MGTIPSSDITGVILAGGHARRMQGRDKGLLPLAGRPMIAHVLDALRPQVDAVLINANRHRDQYARFGVPVVPDLDHRFAGPLAGMAAALHHIETDWAVTVPCDAPRLAPDLVARLVAANGGQHPLCVARTADGLQPVWCLMHRSLAPTLEESLAAGRRKVAAWLAAEGARAVDFGDTGAFLNLNTEAELRRADALGDDGTGARPRTPDRTPTGAR